MKQSGRRNRDTKPTKATGGPWPAAFERCEHDGALVECEREQLHLIGDGALEPVGQALGPQQGLFVFVRDG